DTPICFGGISTVRTRSFGEGQDASSSTRTGTVAWRFARSPRRPWPTPCTSRRPNRPVVRAPTSNRPKSDLARMRPGLRGEHRREPPLPAGRVARRRLQRSWARRVVVLAGLAGAILGVVVGLRPPRLDIGGGGEPGGRPAVSLEIRLGGDLAAAVPGEGRLWVVNRSPKSVMRLDPATGARKATIFLPETAMTSEIGRASWRGR